MKIKLFVFCLLASSTMQAQPTSSALYNSKGRLRADTTFSIPGLQLIKWKAAEDSLCSKILPRLVYPEIMREAGMEQQMIVSFNLNDDGTFSDITVEKLDSTYTRITDTSKVTGDRKLSYLIATIALKPASGNIRAFVSKGKKEKYYVPLALHLVKTRTARHIREGWLCYDLNPPRSIEQY